MNQINRKVFDILQVLKEAKVESPFAFDSISQRHSELVAPSRPTQESQPHEEHQLGSQH